MLFRNPFSWHRDDDPSYGRHPGRDRHFHSHEHHHYYDDMPNRRRMHNNQSLSHQDDEMRMQPDRPWRR